MLGTLQQIVGLNSIIQCVTLGNVRVSRYMKTAYTVSWYMKSEEVERWLFSHVILKSGKKKYVIPSDEVSCHL